MSESLGFVADLGLFSVPSLPGQILLNLIFLVSKVSKISPTIQIGLGMGIGPEEF